MFKNNFEKKNQQAKQFCVKEGGWGCYVTGISKGVGSKFTGFGPKSTKKEVPIFQFYNMSIYAK